MACKNIQLLFSFILLCSCSSPMKHSTVIDRYLIVPGKSAEGYIIGDTVVRDSSMIELKEKNSMPEILGADILAGLRFDSVLYIKDSAVLFIKDNRIIAVAGLKLTKHVTYDAVLLSKGIDNFIMNYGNDGLRIVPAGKHKAYIYKDAGIAVFDDNGDNIIDMYLVFH